MDCRLFKEENPTVPLMQHIRELPSSSLDESCSNIKRFYIQTLKRLFLEDLLEEIPELWVRYNLNEEGPAPSLRLGTSSSLLCRVPTSSPCSLGASQRAWTLRQAKKETCSWLWETDGPQDGGWVLWNLVRDGPKWTGKIQASLKGKMFLKTEQIGKWIELTSRDWGVETSRGGEDDCTWTSLEAKMFCP